MASYGKFKDFEIRDVTYLVDPPKDRPIEFDLVKWLDSIGYNTYYQVLNAKNYGIPQNRERVFAISIRKDVDTNGFTFPEPIPLTTRLKDILEHNVDEKYYLSDDRIDKILNSSFIQEKKRIQTTDVCDTLLARDWKDPKCVPIDEETQNSYNDKVSIPLKRGYSVDVSTCKRKPWAGYGYYRATNCSKVRR